MPALLCQPPEPRIHVHQIRTGRGVVRIRKVPIADAAKPLVLSKEQEVDDKLRERLTIATRFTIRRSMCLRYGLNYSHHCLCF
ncbi:hypothetical protein CGMCC3_g10235 [Colletotrichum fructicola]|nr:uncharacterized protein CGMCC3_g10235 [Colletotrichum fructicola]KAE9573819.1 hypothetical protein CGMCC3_g10235 [Colletotrichum fructicola]